MKPQNFSVQLYQVSKQYVLHHEKPTLVEKFIKTKDEIFLALKKIDLKIAKGERVGITGPNGSGKTTLLKIITGITAPTSGSVQTKGRIVSIIDLESGFHPDLTGEQNIVTNGLLLGMCRDEIHKKFKQIVDFADIKQFIDAPLYTYSSGMLLRLGFAVAVHANPDILIVDESFSVGDTNFQRKSQAKIREFFRQKKTIILVSHWQEFLRKNCQRLITLRSGTIVSDRLIGLHEKSR